MDANYLATLRNELVRKGLRIEDGLSALEVARAEDAFGFQFPSDLRLVLEAFLPVSYKWTPWRSGSHAQLNELFRGPAEGVEFDIEHNAFWFGTWGPRPTLNEDALEVARRHLKELPPLIPIYGHRYMPSDPSSAGNPVFSVVQTDVIVYGNDLAHYFAAEFRVTRPPWSMSEARAIEFWSEVVNRSNETT